MRLIGKKKREGREGGKPKREREGEGGERYNGAEETARERCSEPNTQRRWEKITRNRSSSMGQVCGIIVSPKSPEKNMFHNLAKLVWVHVRDLGEKRLCSDAGG